MTFKNMQYCNLNKKPKLLITMHFIPNDNVVKIKHAFTQKTHKKGMKYFTCVNKYTNKCIFYIKIILRKSQLL